MPRKYTRRRASKKAGLGKFIKNITYKVYGSPKSLKLKAKMTKPQYNTLLKRLALPLKSQTNLFDRLKKLEYKLKLSKRKRDSRRPRKRRARRYTRR